MFKPTVRTTTVLDRIGPKRADTAFMATQIDHPGARFMVLAGLKPLIVSDAERTAASLRWLSRADLGRCGLPLDDAIFLGLGREDRVPHFALAFDEHRVRASPMAIEMLRPIVDLRTLATQGTMSADDVSLAGQARALGAWHVNARHCGHCGGVTRVKDAGWRRKCWACGLEHFPRTDPVVIMLVVDPASDRCLLGHEARFQEKMFSTLAGFIEAGEDIEHAVRREVEEEAGIVVGRVHFHSTQPWPFPHSLMIGCVGVAQTTDIQIDPTELQEARWFSRAEVSQMADGQHPEGLFIPGPHAIARALINAFIDGTWDG